MEALEEQFANVLAALAAQWTSFSDAAKVQAGRVAAAASGRVRPKKRNGNGAGDGGVP